MKRITERSNLGYEEFRSTLWNLANSYEDSFSKDKVINLIDLIQDGLKYEYIIINPADSKSGEFLLKQISNAIVDIEKNYNL